LFQQKRLGPAAAHTSRALLLEPEGRRKGALLYNLGRIAEDQGEPDKAADHYRRSLAVRPGNGEARKRLDALTANAKPRAKAPLDAMCEAATDDWNCTKGDAPEGSECTCKVERVIEPDKNSPFLRAALLSVWGHPDIGGVHDGTLHLAVETESGGWQHLSMIANSLSPGVAYIHNHGEVTAMRYEDAIPGGPQELVLDISQDEDDGDYGENVNEYSTLRATFVCWQDEAPRCAYLPRAYTYGLGPMVDDLPPPPEVWERSWSLSMRLNPDATVTYAVESGGEWLTAPQKELLGTHPLRDVGRFYEATVTELR
jgi:tetratricopeptide (TPR) repeat protein